MPAKRRSKAAADPAEAVADSASPSTDVASPHEPVAEASAAPPAAEPDQATDAPPASSASTSSASTPPEFAPLNRAERRARRKGGAQPQFQGRVKVAGGKGPVQAPRMWANRRSG